MGIFDQFDQVDEVEENLTTGVDSTVAAPQVTPDQPQVQAPAPSPSEPAQTPARKKVLQLDPEVEALANQYAEQNGVSAALVRGIIRQESAGKQEATSKTGASGLMQITKPALDDVNARFGTSYTRDQMRTDAKANLDVGTKYISLMLQQQGGDVEKALAAYNGGAGHLQSVGGDWRKTRPETANYVPAVLSKMDEDLPGGAAVPAADVQKSVPYTENVQDGNVFGQFDQVGDGEDPDVAPNEFDIFDQEDLPEELPKEAPRDEPGAEDYGRIAMSGLASTGGMVAGLGEYVGNMVGADRVRDFFTVLRKAADDATEYWQSGLSDAGKRDMEKKYATTGADAAWKDLDSVMFTIIASAPSTVLTLGPAGLAARGAWAAKIAGGGTKAAATAAAAKAATIAGAVTEGALGAGGIAKDITTTIEQMSDQELRSLEAYNRLKGEYPGMNDEDIRRGVIANATRWNAAIGGVVTAGVGAVAGPVEARLFTEGAGGFIARGAKGALSEGVQEGLQSPTETLLTNIGTEKEDITEGLLESTLAGVVGGAGAGGPMAAFGGGGDKKAPEATNLAGEIDSVLSDTPEADAAVEENLQRAESEARVSDIEREQNNARAAAAAAGGDLLDQEIAAAGVGDILEQEDNKIKSHLQRIRERIDQEMKVNAEQDKVAAEREKAVLKDQEDVTKAVTEALKATEEDRAYAEKEAADGKLVIGQTGIDGSITEQLTEKQKKGLERTAQPQVTNNQMAEAFRAAAEGAATSPTNDTAEPTPKQIQAGNYKKGHARMNGLQVTIENPAGSTRTAADGSWSQKLQDHYGYIKGTESAEGPQEQLDVFVGDDHESPNIFVVDQIKKDGSFDEHKVMMGYPNAVAARRAYSRNYPKGFKVGPISTMSAKEFKDWLNNGDQTVPLQPGKIAGAPAAATASPKEEVIQPTTRKGGRGARPEDLGVAAEEALTDTRNSRKSIRYRLEEPVADKIKANAPDDVMEELQYLSEGYEEGENLQLALEDAIDVAESEGNKKFLNKLHKVGIAVGMYREMSESEIANTQTNRGKVYDFKQGGKAYKYNEDYVSSAQAAGGEVNDGDAYFAPRAHERAKSEASGNSRTKTIHMSPDEFLKMAFGLKEGPDQDKASTVKDLADKGTKFSTIPQLSFEIDEFGQAVVSGHEGRHRAMELKARGVKSMPVSLTSGEWGAGPAIRWNSHTGALPTNMISEDRKNEMKFPVTAEAAPATGETVDATHYGKVANVDVLKGEKYGTGIRGQEATRLSDPEYSDIRNRVYFYGPEHTKEPGLGNNEYKWPQEGVYNLDKDPDNIKGKVQEWAKETGNSRDVNTKANQLDRFIKEAGYKGVMSYEKNGVGYVFGDVTPTKATGLEGTKIVDEDGAPLVVYRGVHGEGKTLKGRLPTFTPNKYIAGDYAADGEHARVGAYRLNIQNPVDLDNGEDVISMKDLRALIGDLSPAEKTLFDKMMQEPNNWRGFVDSARVGKITQEELNQGEIPDDVYTDSFEIADSLEFVELMKNRGYDGIIIRGPFEATDEAGVIPDDEANRLSIDGEVEYRPFSNDQVVTDMDKVKGSRTTEKGVRYRLGDNVDAKTILKNIKKDGDGFTVDNATGEHKREGYSVGIGKEQVFDGVPTVAQVEAFREKNAEALAQEGHYLGGWMDGGQTYLDVSRVFGSNKLGRKGGMALAVKNNEKGIQHLDEGGEGYIPNPEYKSPLKKWFGNSKVVGKNGEPLEVYHGTDADFDTFKANAPKTFSDTHDEEGIYFSGSMEQGANYARGGMRRPKGGAKPRVIRAYLKMENPLNITKDIVGREKGVSFGDAKRAALANLLPEHDGVIFEGDAFNPAEYVVFKPEQIKSATDNVGTFSSADPRFRYRLEDEAPKDGRAFKNFFSKVTKGLTGTSSTGAEYTPVISAVAAEMQSPRSKVAKYSAEYIKHRGKFDDHIAFSIPGYKEVQQAVGAAIASVYNSKSNMLDIGASEGSFAKAITAISKMKTVSLDPNPDMHESFKNVSTVRGAEYSMSALGTAEQEGQLAWKEDDVDIDYYDPMGTTFDVVHEAMVFQFIDNGREAQISRVKELLSAGGVFITEEKLHTDNAAANEKKKNEDHKAKYFEKKDLDAKSAEVLEGMHKNMVTDQSLEATLQKNFAYVVQFWDSGNFKGYMASDSKAAVDKIIANMPSLESEFATTATPRVIQGQGEFDLGEAAGLAPTDTVAFHKWFGKSQVTNSRGRPLVVYHGTTADVESFKNVGGKISILFSTMDIERHGFFFTSSVKSATGYATQDAEPGRLAPGANLIPVHLSIQNPIYLNRAMDDTERAALVAAGVNPRAFESFYGEAWQLFDENTGRENIEALKRAGFDGALIEEEDAETGKIFEAWVAFDNTQIKSAIGNRGTFDANESSILKRLEGEKSAPRGLSSAGVKELLAPMLEKMSLLNPIIVDNESQLPEGIQVQLETDNVKNIRGIFDPVTGDLYILAENHDSDSDVIRTLLHEGVAHKGLRVLLGDAHDDVMLDIFDNGDRAKLEMIARKYGLDLTKTDDQIEAAEEYTAYIAENDVQSTVFQKVLAHVRQALRSLGIVSEWTDADIEALLIRAKRKLNGKPMSSVSVKTEVVNETTGKTSERSVPADAALRRVKKRQEVCAKVKGCVG